MAKNKEMIPFFPSAANPTNVVDPIKTPFAPKANPFKTSVPLLKPLSTSIAISVPSISLTISGKTSNGCAA